MRLSKIYVPLTFAVIAASFILTSGWNFGLGVSPDSVSYISTADSLSQGEGLRTFSGPFVSWPPLTPLSLYLGKALSGSALHSATWLNSIWVFLTVFLSLWIDLPPNFASSNIGDKIVKYGGKSWETFATVKNKLLLS